MSRCLDTRREFLKTATVLGGSALLSARATRGADEGPGGRLHLACNQYPWTVFYARENRDFGASLDSGLAEVAQTGVDGFEPLVTGPPQIDQLAPLLKKHGLQMRSLYVNSTLHRPDQAEASIEQVLSIAEKAKRLGTKIIVTNPNPIRWGGPEDKNDAQLRFQARALSKLGTRLKEMGLVLAYHNHDAELRNAAREFHHMMLGTDAALVTLCLDAHWIYRGAGNSAVALFDVLKLYGRRVSELHLRQSVDHVWTEALGDGDIDYPRLAKQLLKIGVRPHLVIEQAVEQGSPKTMNAIEAHRRSCAYARRVFAAFAG
jgi:inosose dehydratase